VEEKLSGRSVTPPLRHRYNKIAYTNRWGIEAFLVKFRQWRRIATGYDKIAANFLGFA